MSKNSQQHNSKPIKHISFIGAGNVAEHLSLALHKTGFEIQCIYSRTLANAENLANQVNAQFVNEIANIPDNSDLYIIALSDDAIVPVLSQKKWKDARLVHTAGSVSMSILQKFSNNIGVFYPLQTFSKNRPIDMAEVPFLLESNSIDLLAELQQIAQKISKTVVNMDSAARAQLHLAAVFTCNFTNHLLHIAHQLAQHAHHNPDLLRPLLEETIAKTQQISPFEAQTGPAKRDDKIVLKKHLHLLAAWPEYEKIYRFVSKSIYNQHKNTTSKLQIMSNFKEALRKIKALIFDVDGVFSKEFLVFNDGDLLRTMNAKDGFALKYALSQGYIIGIITGGNTESVRTRFAQLGITDIYLNSHNKIEDFEDFRYKYDLQPEEIVYMGDDLPDYEVMKAAGIATCPADAVEEIQSISHYISDKAAGDACVRDIIEQVLRVQNKWSSPNK